jgi:uncharacterized protein
VIAFLDSSVLLRKLLGEPRSLAEWPQIRRAYASRLLPIEVARVIDRCRLDGQIDDAEVATLHLEARRVLRSVEIVALTEHILLAAGAAMPTVVGTLDALHLVTALELAKQVAPLVLATHDVQLGRAAQSSGLPVIGL